MGATIDEPGRVERLRRLADTTRASGQVHRDDQAQRDGAIFEAYTGGWSLAQIAAATGLDKSRIHRIVVACEQQAWAQAAQAVP